MSNRYPCVMQDDESGYWFVAESTGPVSWKYHRWRIFAILERIIYGRRQTKLEKNNICGGGR